jgi:hypothetical protein
MLRKTQPPARDEGDSLPFSYPADHPLAAEFKEQLKRLVREYIGEILLTPALVAPEYVATMRNWLTSFHKQSASFIAAYGGLPAEHSQALKEQSSYANPEKVVSACALGMQLIEFGADHLSAFVKIITEPIEQMSAWTCVRSMLEGCSVSAWLLDPSIDSHTRVGRTFALRYEGMQSELKFMRVSGFPQHDQQKTKERIDAVEQEAIAAGFAPVLNKKGERIGIGQQMPSATDIIQTVLNDGKMYCLLSAVSHAHAYAIRGLNYLRFEPGDDVLSNVPVLAFKKNANLPGLALLGLSASMAMARPLWNQCLYYGWDSLRFEEILERTFDGLDVKYERR